MSANTVSKSVLDAKFKKVFALLTQVLGDAGSAVVHWADDLRTSTNLAQWVSGLSGANGAGGAIPLNPAAWIQGNTGGSDANATMVRLFPLAATGSTTFGWTMGTEANLGHQNPTWQMGYNVDANPGFERCIWAIEQNFKFSAGPDIFDTETHIEFFDQANALLCRALSSTLWMSLGNRVDTLCSFRDGTGGNVGSWTVTEASTLADYLVVNTAGILLGRSLVHWPDGLLPLLAQDDNATTRFVVPLKIKPQRSSTAQGAGGVLEIDIQAPQLAGADGFVDVRHETAANSGVFASFLTVALDPVSGTAAVLMATAGGLIARNSATTSLFFLDAAATDFVRIGSGNLATDANGSHIVHLGAAAGTQRLISSTGHTLGVMGLYTGSFVGVWLGVDTTNVGIVPHLWSDSSTLTALNAPPGGDVFVQVAGNSITDTNSTGLLPVTDNTFTCGTAAKRWSLVRGVVVTSGDLDLCDEAHGAHWTLREETDCILAVNRETDEWFKLPLVPLSAEEKARYSKRPLSTATKDSLKPANDQEKAA